MAPARAPAGGGGPGGAAPITRLPADDLEMVTELVLQSGSLKGLAAAYGVSYPTIRTRLDQLIERLRALVAGREPDPVNELLASLVERGELSASGARELKHRIREQRARKTAPEPDGPSGDE